MPADGILAVWHEHFLLCLPAFSHLKLTALVSRSRDGELAARACQSFGYNVARGSSSRGGAEGLLQLARRLSSQGGWAAVVVDGPRGPRRQSKPGILWLARQTGRPVTAASAMASPSLRARNWDQTVIPAPFAAVTLKLAKPCMPETTEDLDRVMRENDRLNYAGECFGVDASSGAGILGSGLIRPGASSHSGGITGSFSGSPEAAAMNQS